MMTTTAHHMAKLRQSAVARPARPGHRAEDWRRGGGEVTCKKCHGDHGPIVEALDNYDWCEAFSVSDEPEHALPSGSCALGKPTRDAVAEIIHLVEGENDGPSWLLVCRLKDDRYLFLDAWCDYTGWDCRSSGSMTVASNLADLLRYGLGNEHRERLGIVLSDAPMTATARERVEEAIRVVYETIGQHAAMIRCDSSNNGCPAEINAAIDALVAEVREEDAKACEDTREQAEMFPTVSGEYRQGFRAGAWGCAAAIRAKR